MLVNGKMREKLEKDEAIRLHRQMWSDMAKAEKERDNTFTVYDRSKFKRNWLQQHGYSSVEHCCFLCEYAMGQEPDWEMHMAPFYCDHCPLDWKKLVPSEQIDKLTEYDGRYGTCVFPIVISKTTHFDEARTYHELWTIAPIENIANLPEKE